MLATSGMIAVDRHDVATCLLKPASLSSSLSACKNLLARAAVRQWSRCPSDEAVWSAEQGNRWQLAPAAAPSSTGGTVVIA